MTNKGSGALGPLRRTITVLSAWCCSPASPAWDRGRCSSACSLTPSPPSASSSGQPTPETAVSSETSAAAAQTRAFCPFFQCIYYRHLLLLDCLEFTLLWLFSGTKRPKNMEQIQSNFHRGFFFFFSPLNEILKSCFKLLPFKESIPRAVFEYM